MDFQPGTPTSDEPQDLFLHHQTLSLQVITIRLRPRLHLQLHHHQTLLAKPGPKLIVDQHSCLRHLDVQPTNAWGLTLPLRLVLRPHHAWSLNSPHYRHWYLLPIMTLWPGLIPYKSLPLLQQRKLLDWPPQSSSWTLNLTTMLTTYRAITISSVKLYMQISPSCQSTFRNSKTPAAAHLLPWWPVLLLWPTKLSDFTLIVIRPNGLSLDHIFGLVHVSV